MKKIIILSLFFVSLFAKAQFNPSQHVVVNDAIGQGQSAPIEGRGMFWDVVNFKWRDFQSTAEVLAYLPTNANRFSHFPVYVHSGGTLTGGVWTGGITLVYFFKDGLANGNLVRWYTDSVIVRTAQDSMWRVNDSTIAFTINGGPTRTVLVRGTSGGGISSLSLTVPSGLYINPVTFSNAGGAWSGSLVLNNQSPNTFFAGPSIGSPGQPTFRALTTTDLPSGIPNGNLQHSSISFALGSSGTSPAWASTPVSLGGTATLNIPTANNINSGILSAFDWNRFNSVAAGAVTSVNGQVGATIVKNADSIKNLPVDTSVRRNNYLLAFDSVLHKWYLAAPSAGTGSVTIVTSGNIPNLATVNVATNTSTPAFTFTPISQSQNLIFASPNGSSGNPTFRSLVNADFPTSGVTAGTYNSLTVNAQGIVTAATSVGSGITTLNALTASTQIFATGAAGADFNIVSSTSTHTFNLPIASGTNTGKLSNTDWTTFNGKQAALSGTGYVKFASTTPSYLTPTQVTADLNIFTSSLQGLVPASGGGTANFMRADGTWALPSQTLQQVISAGAIMTTNNTITNTSQIFNITGGQIRFNGVRTSTNAAFVYMKDTDSSFTELTVSAFAALLPVNTLYVKRGLSNSNDSTFVLGNIARFDSAVYLNGGNAFKMELDSMTAATGRGFRVNFGSDAGWDMVVRDSATGFWTRVAKGTPGQSFQMLSAGGVGWAAQTGGGGGSQTFPQVLATGRTFSANDSVLLGTTTLKFKGTGGIGAGTFGKVVFYTSANTSAQPKVLSDQTMQMIGNRGYLGDTTLNEPTYLEFGEFPSWGGGGRGVVGVMGSPEFNFGLNFNYRNGTHRYYDSLFDALWTFYGSNGFGFQGVGKGHSNQTDIYLANGVVMSRFNWLKSGNDYIGGTLSTNGVKIFEQASTDRDMTTGNFANFSASAASGGMYTFGNIKNRFYWTGTGANGSSTEQYFEAKRTGGTPFLLTTGDTMMVLNTNTVGYAMFRASADAPGNFSSPDFILKQQNASGTMTNTFSVLHTGFVGINTVTPAYALDMNSTGAFRMPIGTTAQRPTAATGVARINTDSANRIEFYNGTTWATLGVSSGGGGFSTWQALLAASPALTANVSQDMATFSITWLKGTALGVSNSYGNYNYYGPPNQGIKIFDSTTNNLNHADWIINGTGSTFQGTMTQYRFASPLITSDPQSTDPTNYGFNAGKSRFAIPTANALTDPIVFFGSNTTGSMLAVFNLATDSRTYALRVNNNGNVAMGLTTATAELHIGAGTATAGRGPLKFTSGTPTTTPEAGLINYNNGLLMLDSSTSVRDTLGTRSWVRNNFSSGGGSGVTTVGTFSGSSQTNGASISGVTITFGPADGTNAGMVSTGTQTLAGNKTFTGNINIGGSSVPTAVHLTVEGNMTGGPGAGYRAFSIWSRLLTNNDVSSTTGTTAQGIYANAFGSPTLTATNTGVNYINSATVVIGGPPILSTNVTSSGNYSLLIDAGNTMFGGDVLSSNGSAVNFAHFQGNTAAPNIVAGTGAGTSPTVSISGNDFSGDVSITTGTLPTAAATVATITYTFTYPANSFPIITPANAITAALSGIAMVYTTGTSTTFVITAGTTALAASTAYKWHYIVTGN